MHAEAAKVKPAFHGPGKEVNKSIMVAQLVAWRRNVGHPNTTFFPPPKNKPKLRRTVTRFFGTRSTFFDAGEDDDDGEQVLSRRQKRVVMAAKHFSIGSSRLITMWMRRLIFFFCSVQKRGVEIRTYV